MSNGPRSWLSWSLERASEAAWSDYGMRWDIFCRVIDNFGDAGVCWRLARILADSGEQVTLWIDRPEVLHQLTGPAPHNNDVSVHAWPDDAMMFAPDRVADVVIEAFACAPPANYVAAMAARAMNGLPPVWINLEYLSAENWVGSHHGLPSPHPHYPLVKHFYFPGFTTDSGGLLREAGLIMQDIPRQPGEKLRIYLFGYEQPALPDWVRAQSNSILSVAPCPMAAQLAAPGVSTPENCTIEWLPFVLQVDFDAVLRAQDLLFVRGEDSFVRAQWAGKPLIWHIYPQDDNAHIGKLEAFYARYLDPVILDSTARHTVMRFVLAWNGSGDPRKCARLWPDMLQILPALQENARHWRQHLLKQPDLVTQLRSFVADLVKCRV